MNKRDKLAVLFVLVIVFAVLLYKPYFDQPAPLKTQALDDRVALIAQAGLNEDPLERCNTFPNMKDADWDANMIGAYCDDQFAPFLALASLNRKLDEEGANSVDAYFAERMADYFANTLPEGSMRGGFYWPFDSATEDVQRYVARWLDANPSSPYALTASGIYHVAAASRARGTKGSSDTPVKNITEMKRLLEIAKQHLHKALELNNRIIPAYLALIDAARFGGERALAGQYFKRGLNVDPASFVLRAAYARVLEPRWGGSLDELDQLAEDAESYQAQNPRLKMLNAVALGYRGFPDYRAGDYQTSSQKFATALAVAPSYFYLDLAAYSEKRIERLDRAFEYYSQMLRFSPRDVGARTNRARVLGELGYLDFAIRDMETLIARAADPLKFSKDYGHLLLLAGKLEEGETTLLEYLNANNDDGWTQHRLVKLYLFELKKPEAAKAILDTMLEQNSCNTHAWLLMAEYHELTGSTGKREALEHYLACVDHADYTQRELIERARQWVKHNPGS